jgi:hypothetical protein
MQMLLILKSPFTTSMEDRSYSFILSRIPHEAKKSLIQILQIFYRYPPVNFSSYFNIQEFEDVFITVGVECIVSSDHSKQYPHLK